MKALLAKSVSSSGKEIRVREHTAMVLSAAEALLSCCGGASLEAAGLGLERLPELGKMLRLSAFVHDLGKCSDHFQGMVHRTRQEPQLIRHEALSLWLCWPGQLLYEWLRPSVDTDLAYQMAIVGAAGHHRKFWTKAVAGRDNGAGEHIELWVHHPDFASTLELGSKILGLGTPPKLEKALILKQKWDENIEDDFAIWQKSYQKALLKGVPGESEVLGALCKALVLCADVAGSALLGEAHPQKWIPEQLSRRPGYEDLGALIERRLEGRALRPFQKAVSQSRAGVTLALAGCGTGKTLAAYLWAQQQHPNKKLWITYPTTGTTTEGFRDYLDKLSVIDSRLEHGRASVDIEIFGLMEDADRSREQDRLDALRAWGTEVLSCTVDTVLGLVQNQRKGLYAWPSLCDGAIVFDEVHAYDGRLFGALLRFVEAMPGIPLLLMSASLPQERLRQLEEAVLKRGRGAMEVVAGPADLEELPRYVRDLSEEPWALVEETLAKAGKVLWVSNTVDRCRGWAEQALARGLQPLMYHSRYKYMDRVERHGDVIEAFREERAGPALAMTTQVAEMSLDLSADLLVTDLAPVPALIQRLGRLNRRSTPEAASAPKPFVVLDFEGLPYGEADLEAARAWLLALGHGKALSQRDLVKAWVPSANESQVEKLCCAWLDGGFVSEAVHLREGEHGVSVLLAEDLPKLKNGTGEMAKYVVPMNDAPKGVRLEGWPRLKFYTVAPVEYIEYDSQRGARWRRPAKARQ